MADKKQKAKTAAKKTTKKVASSSKRAAAKAPARKAASARTSSAPRAAAKKAPSKTTASRAATKTKTAAKSPATKSKTTVAKPTKAKAPVAAKSGKTKAAAAKSTTKTAAKAKTTATKKASVKEAMKAAQAKIAAAQKAKAKSTAKAKPAAKAAKAAPKPAAKPVAAKAAPAAKAAAAARPAQTSAPTTTGKKKKLAGQRHGFKINEHVVYPAHGVGKIIGIEEQEIAGMALELFVINFDKEKLTLRVPTGKLESVGMRKLADEALVKKALTVLKGRARIKRTMWSRRAQEYIAKINSGDLISIAEVVRDLYRSEAQPEQSYSERQLYEDALDRMARELAAIERLDERGAVQKITDVLSKSARGRRLAEEEAADAEAAEAASAA